jgi:hypothetical protein
MQLEAKGPGGLNPFTPMLTIGYDNPDGGLMNVLVSLNGHLLRSLDPEGEETEFGLPVNFLALNNEIDIFNGGLSSITLNDQFFYTGDIDTNPQPVPVPASVVLLCSGLLVMLAGGRGLKGLVVRTRTK